MNSRKINFENSENQNLTGLLDLPVGKKVKGYALFAHCFTCNKNLLAPKYIAKSLTALGFAVLRFDFTGLGQSDGEFEETDFNTNIKDLVSASKYLEKEWEAPTLLIGHSLGGAAIIAAAEQIKSTKAVITIGAPYSPNHVTHLFDHSLPTIEKEGSAKVNIGGRPFTISAEFVKSVEEQNQLRALNQLKAPILIMHAPEDDIVSVSNAADIYKAAQHPKSYVSLDGADHLLTDKKDSTFAAEMLATWSKRYLNLEPPSPPKVRKEVAVKIEGEKYTTYLSTGDHHLVADEPEDMGGQNMGPSPYQLLNAALGTCTAMTLRMYADHKQIPLEEVEVHLSYAKEHVEDCEENVEGKGKKMDIIEREIELVGDLSEKERERLLEIADRCPVHKTLTTDTKIKTKLVE